MNKDVANNLIKIYSGFDKYELSNKPQLSGDRLMFRKAGTGEMAIFIEAKDPVTYEVMLNDKDGIIWARDTYSTYEVDNPICEKMEWATKDYGKTVIFDMTEMKMLRQYGMNNKYDTMERIKKSITPNSEHVLDMRLSALYEKLKMMPDGNVASLLDIVMRHNNPDMKASLRGKLSVLKGRVAKKNSTDGQSLNKSI